MRGELEALAAKLNVSDYLVMPGNEPQSALSQLIVAAAAVLSPHTGRALAEAAFGGAPIIAYDIDWQSELIDAGETGELVPFRDVDGMTRATLSVLKDQNYAAFLGAAVRKRALEKLDPERLNEHERSCYSAILGEADSAAEAESAEF